MPKKDDLYSWIIRGKQRYPIFMTLDGKKMPSLICREAKKVNPKISLNTTSDVLKDLKTKKLVLCLNEEAKTGRLYTLTSLGKTLQEECLNSGRKE
ncbi:MarR family transcriptional regulator [Candidatus Woesearchaeota archaeon]|nr:MarR family transcriptional regulator [Candidatus Woesearchaeota archaeon]